MISCFVSSYSFLEVSKLISLSACGTCFLWPEIFWGTQHNFSLTPILSQDLINKTDKWQFPKNALDSEKFHISLKSNQLPFQPWRTSKTSCDYWCLFRRMILVCPQMNNFCRQLGHPHGRNFFSNNSKKKNKNKTKQKQIESFWVSFPLHFLCYFQVYVLYTSQSNFM